VVRHFQQELDDLQQRLLEMAGLVEFAVHGSVRSLVDRDDRQAEQVLQNETRINQLQMQVDDLATRLLALHQPMARDLRFLTAAIKINVDLERMGDLAVNLAERSLSLVRRPPVKPLIDIPHMAGLVESMVRKSLDSFVKRDGDLAHVVLRSDDEVDDLKNVIYDELVQFMERDASTVRRGVDLMFVAHNLERIADHATNIAEDVLYLVRGIDVRHHTEVAE
jgi:phosphate transport system protein